MLAKVFRNFRKDQSGVAALEFSLVVLPLITLIATTIELGLFFFNASVLESSVRDATRLVRTGQAAFSADPETLFRDKMCESLFLIPCADVVLEVQPYPTFADASEVEPVYNDDDELQPLGFEIGNSGDVVIARASYQYPFITPLAGSLLSGNVNNTMEIHAVSIFRNEPFDFN